MKDTLKVLILQPGCYNGGPCLSNYKKKRGWKKRTKKNQSKQDYFLCLKIKKDPDLSRHIRAGI